MAVGTSQDFEIYNDQINGAIAEVVMQNVDAFGPASKGAITIIPEAERGDFRYESFFTEGDDVNERDPDSLADRTDEPLEQDEDISVKLHRDKSKATTRNQWLRIGKNPEEFSQIYGRQLGGKMFKDYLNTALYAVTAALAGVSGDVLKYDMGGSDTLTHLGLNGGLSKAGDSAGGIICFIGHSKPWHDLMGSAISSPLIDVGGLVVREGTTQTLGRPFVVTDSPALILPGSPHKYITLGLRMGGVTVQESEPVYTTTEEVTNKKNIFHRIVSEWAFNLGVKGFKYRVGAGANPDRATIASSGNWTQNVTDTKSAAGVYVISH